MDHFFYFAETTLLWIVGIFFLVGVGLRSLFFLGTLIRKHTRAPRSWGAAARFLAFWRLFVPFHKALSKRPLYAVLRYAFHGCLFVVPVWFSGHIYLWEESRFMWYWTPLPDDLADGMTLFVIAICLFFSLRRLFIREIRRTSSAVDGLIILVAALPFVSGYCLTHGTLNRIAFFDRYLLSLHIVAGEIMLAAIVFLFVRTRLNANRCVGCAACVENCPTQALAYTDAAALRTVRYSHYQCICCGACVAVCPDQAAELRHEISVFHFFRIFSKKVIRTLELARCERCGVFFGPRTQVAKLAGVLADNAVEAAVVHLCSRCRKRMASRDPASVRERWSENSKTQIRT